MTAFNNIKTNNWPAASNDLEDFLVLKLPLNDQASLTESLPVTAGSTVLHPKRTLANTGVSMFDLGVVWSNFLTSEYTLTNAAKAFNGSTSDGAEEWDGTYNVTRNPPYKIEFIPPSPIAYSNLVRVYSAGGPQHPYNNTISVDLGSGYGSATSVIQNDWVTVATGSGSLTKLKAEATQNGTNIRAIEIDGQILVDGIPKKHYDAAASFNNSSSYLRPPDSSNFAFGTDDFTVECWIYTLAHKNYIAYLDTRETGQTDAAGWTLATNASGDLYVYSAGFLVNSSLSLNQWTHVAYCRASGTHALYVNGSLAESSTTARNYTDDKLTIGANSYGGSEVHNGYLQDVRIYKGVAKYTADFTPPGAILG